ncbi:MAG: MAPEG family protein [Nitratireductor sp.]
MNTVAVTCTAALAFLQFGMGWPISGLRNSRKQYIGFSSDPSDLLHKAVRAHGNTSEYSAFLAVMYLYLGSRDPASWIVWSMIGATICRYLYVLGMIAFPTMANPNLVRFVGAGGTYTFGLILAVAMLLSR